MSKKAKTTFILAALYFFGFGALLAYGLFLVYTTGTALEVERVRAAEQAAKEISYNTVIAQTEVTKNDRVALASFFITEKDTVSFIAELERAADAVGVSFETTGLSVVPAANGKPAELSVDCTFKGGESAVKKFVTVLENIPYRTVMTHLLITNSTDTDGAKGQALFKITLKP